MEKQLDVSCICSFMTASLLVLALLLTAASLGLAGAPASHEAQARIEFPELTFDFGTMYQNEEVTHLFTFRNIGRAPLEIGKVKSSCGCTAAMPEKRELAPGEETTLKVTFRSGTMRDRVVKHVYVDSNDPVEPRVTLTVQGAVKVEIELSPRGVYVGRLAVGEAVQRSVELTPVDVPGFRILGTTSNNPAARVISVLPLGDERPGYKLTIEVGPLQEPGRINAKVTVRTDLAHTKELQIPVYGKIVSAEDADKDSPQQ